jgi:urea transport system substrate-binding protein
MSIESEANDAFKENFQTWLKTEAPDAVQKEGRVTCSPMVLSYNGVYLWKAAG